MAEEEQTNQPTKSSTSTTTINMVIMIKTKTTTIINMITITTIKIMIITITNQLLQLNKIIDIQPRCLNQRSLHNPKKVANQLLMTTVMKMKAGLLRQCLLRKRQQRNKWLLWMIVMMIDSYIIFII